MGEGVWASGESGMFPADLQRAERYWRWSLGERPCRELGRMCWDGAGELGVLEAGELLWDEAPEGEEQKEITHQSRSWIGWRRCPLPTQV